MKRILLSLCVLFPALALAGGPSVPLDKANIDLTDKASLQRGAQTFMNYCLGCHQMQYQRYQRSFNDLGIPLELGQEHLIFDGSKVGEHILNSMPEKDAGKWFGAAPPDLTLSAPKRGADWLYTYLRTFYVEEGKTFGVNNKVFPDVGMPHVLEPLQGTPRKTMEKRMVDGEMKDVYVGIKATGGELSASEYDKLVLDLVNYMVYVGEPVQLERRHLGAWVLAFIAVLFIFVALLKKEYWRDVH